MGCFIMSGNQKKVDLFMYKINLFNVYIVNLFKKWIDFKYRFILEKLKCM